MRGKTEVIGIKPQHEGMGFLLDGRIKEAGEERSLRFVDAGRSHRVGGILGRQRHMAARGIKPVNPNRTWEAQYPEGSRRLYILGKSVSPTTTRTRFTFIQETPPWLASRKKPSASASSGPAIFPSSTQRRVKKCPGAKLIAVVGTATRIDANARAAEVRMQELRLHLEALVE